MYARANSANLLSTNINIIYIENCLIFPKKRVKAREGDIRFVTPFTILYLASGPRSPPMATSMFGCGKTFVLRLV